MKKKIIFSLIMMIALTLTLVLMVSADDSFTHTGKVDLSATVTLSGSYVDANGNAVTTVNLFDEDGNALIWYKDASGVLQSIRADDSKVRYKATYQFNVGNATVGSVTAYEVSDMWIALDSGNISKTSVVVLNLMDDDVLTNEASNSSYLNKPVNCVKTIQWSNKIVEYAYLRLDTYAIQQQAFSGCTMLKYVNLEDLTELRQIGGSQAFSSSSNLFKGEELDLTGTKLVAFSGSGAFNGLPITALKLPKTVTSLGGSGSNDGWNLQGTNLVSFVYPETITYIANAQFKNCSKLQSIYIHGTTTQIISNAFLSTNALEKVFFVGTFEQANALISATNATGNSKFLEVAANLISYTDYLALEDNSGKYFVYDYSYCEAYNEGVHTNESTGIAYANGYDKSGVLTCTCSTCELVTNSVSAPLITMLGYATDEENGRIILSSGFIVDTELVEIYNTLNGTKLVVGILFANSKDLADSVPANLEGIMHRTDEGFATYNYVITFPNADDSNYEEYATFEFVVSAFIYENENYVFFSNNTEDTVVSTLNSGFTTTTLDKVQSVQTNESQALVSNELVYNVVNNDELVYYVKESYYI